MQTLIAFMTLKHAVDLFDELLGSSGTIQIELTDTTLAMVRRDGTQIDPAQVGTLLLQEEHTPLERYLAESTPNGDGFGGRAAHGVSRQAYQRVVQHLAPMGITVTRT